MPDADFITGEIDFADLAEGGDGIVYASTVEEAAAIRAELRGQGLSLHGVGSPTDAEA